VADLEINPYRDAVGTPQLRPSVAAFLDILGYRDYIGKAFHEGKGQKELVRLRTALDVAYQYLKDPLFGQNFDGKMAFQVRSFTDNLIIGYPIPERVGALHILLAVVGYIGYLQAELARQGYFARGAISVGELYVDDDIVFGPAMMEAYRAEQTVAVYPRVILCDSAEVPYRENGPDQAAPELLVDSDRRVFIDYLDSTVMIAYPDDRPFTEFLEGHKTAVIAKLEEFRRNPYIRAKYEWAAIYHNAFCNAHPDLFGNDEKISSALLAPIPGAWKPGL
jgi:hypothetical protein